MLPKVQELYINLLQGKEKACHITEQHRVSKENI